MDITFLIKEYFKGVEDNISIDVFDAQTLSSVYSDVLKVLTSHFEIETSVLQSLSYCFYEILDNVHVHSGKPLGTAITFFDSRKAVLRVLVADDGVGVRTSLGDNPLYSRISEEEALRICLNDAVTDGKGMGFGLYATSRLIKEAGLKFVIHSGRHKLIESEGKLSVIENGFWQGTIIYLEISTMADINPNYVVDNRTNIEGEYNEAFIATEELDNLW